MLSLIVVSLFTTYKSIFFGWDIDESYAISLSYRLVMGDDMFRNMWEVHQTSGIFMAPLIYLYRMVAGNSIGMVVFLRSVGCLVQLIIAVFLYDSLSCHVSRKYALILAAVFYNFSPKYLQSFEFCFLNYLFMTCVLVCMLYYKRYNQKIWLALTGVFLACTVLAYPTSFIMVPFEYFCIYRFMRTEKETGHASQAAWIVFAAEAVCGIIFIGYLLTGGNPKEILENIPYILSDQSHQISFFEKVIVYFKETAGLALSFIISVAAVEIFAMIFAGGRKNFGQILLVLVQAAYLFGTVLNYKNAGINHLHTSYIILGLIFSFLYIAFRIRRSDKIYNTSMFWLAGCLVCVFAGSCIGSNLPLYANSGLLLPVLILFAVDWCKTMKKDKPDFKYASWIYVFAAVFLLSRCFLVRFTAVQPVTIFDRLYKIEVGTGKGIYVTEKEHVQYHDKMQLIQQYVTPEDELMYLGGDAYLWFFVGSNVASPVTISTPVYDETTVEYFERYPDKKPTVIALDKYWSSIEDVLDIPGFGDWISQNYDLENAVESGCMALYFPR